MTELPSWLIEDRESYRSGVTEHQSTDPADLLAGDLWTVSSDGLGSPRRVVLVLNAEGCNLDVALASNETEWATDRDITLLPNDTGAPYSLMIETALTGRVPWAMVRERVGAIDGELLDDVLDFIWDERPPQLEHRRGPVVPNPLDQERVEFEISEATDLRRLASAPGRVFAIACETIGPQTSLEQSRRLFGLLLRADSVVCHGLIPAEHIEQSARPDVSAAMLGPDLVQWRLNELAARKLLCTPTNVPCTNPAGDAFEAVFNRRPIHDEWFFVESPESRDGPIGTAGGARVFVGSSTDQEGS